MTALLLACEPLRAVNRFLQSPNYELVFVAKSSEPVRGESGTIVRPMTTFDGTGTDFDLIIVAAPPAPGETSNDQLSRFLHRHAAKGARLCGLDGGVLLLAEAGLLDGHRVAADEKHRKRLVACCRQVDIADTPFAIDRSRLTCGGGMAVHDLFVTVVKDDHGIEMVRFVEADIIALPAREPATGPEHRDDNASVFVCSHMRRTDELMASNIREPLRIPEIAGRLGVSVRQLQMLSQHHCKDTISNRYLDIRLKAAQGMLKDSDRSIVEIAAETGFSSASTFGRAFKRRFHLNASAFRASFRRSGSQPVIGRRS